MERVCIHHAGCPDGFGAAFAAWRAWGDAARYVARGHDDPLDPVALTGAQVVFADIAPPASALRSLGDCVGQLVVLDHHVTARDRYRQEAPLVDELEREGHHIRFDLDHSGAILAWQHFHPDVPAPELLRYVEDQDLWRFALPDTREVNAAIAAAPRTFAAWDALARTPVGELAREGAPIVRMADQEVARALTSAHPVALGDLRVEAVNARENRSRIGHELAVRARFGVPVGLVYRLTGRRVDVSIYSVGDFDVAGLAAAHGGGGHASAAGFSVPLDDWLARFT